MWLVLGPAPRPDFRSSCPQGDPEVPVSQPFPDSAATRCVEPAPAVDRDVRPVRLACLLPRGMARPSANRLHPPSLLGRSAQSTALSNPTNQED